MQKIKNFLQSRKFLYVIIAFFAAQAIFFAAAINYKVPSDEEYHYTFTNYYAQRPISTGPVIANQNELFNLGDIQRTPSYLYHYIMSFYLRIVQLFTSSIETQVFMLRLLNVSFGVIALLLLVRFARKIGVSELTTNLTIAWLSMTGMFIWVFAGITYDNLALTIFFLFLLQLVNLKEQLKVQALIRAILSGVILVLVKETYLPVVILGFLLLFGYRIGSTGIKNNLNELSGSLRDTWRSKSRLLFMVLCVLTILASGLFIERYAVNYARYKKFTPTCDQVHTVDECMQQGIYRRNTGQKKEFEQRKKEQEVRLDSLPMYSAKWVGYIYQRTYFYRGMQTIPSNQKASRLAFITATFAGMLLIFGALNIRKLNSLQLGLVAVTIFYLLMVLFYNFNTYRFYGYPFAVQGRYLLPILPFIYMAVIGSARMLYRKLGNTMKLFFVVTLILVIGNNIMVHSPLIIYLNGRSLLDIPVVGLLRNII